MQPDDGGSFPVPHALPFIKRSGIRRKSLFNVKLLHPSCNMNSSTFQLGCNHNPTAKHKRMDCTSLVVCQSKYFPPSLHDKGGRRRLQEYGYKRA
eukprot:scaffold9419_cov73-Skeletonema_marinoi.AAC.1